MKKMLILLFLIGCSQSPLLNHTTAGAMTESFESKLGFPVVKMGFLIEWEAGCPQAGECILMGLIKTFLMNLLAICGCALWDMALLR